MLTFKYIPKQHYIIIQDTEAKNGVHLTQMNNVGDGMAEFLKRIVEQANQNQEKVDADEN